LKQFSHAKIQPAWEVLAMRLLLDLNKQVAAFDTAKIPKWVMESKVNPWMTSGLFIPPGIRFSNATSMSDLAIYQD
jgi:hypothetical protein